jgi:hypothetical protein
MSIMQIATEPVWPLASIDKGLSPLGSKRNLKKIKNQMLT